MSAFVLNRNYELQLPSSFVDIDCEEMEYVDGGFSRGWVAFAVDAVALAFCPYLAPVKYMGKAAAIAFIKVHLPKLAGAFRSIVQTAIGASINISTGALGNLLFANAWCFTSIGGMVSVAADYFSDGSLDGQVRF